MPILYEVNTRVWLRDLSEAAGHVLTLAEVPDTEIQRWRSFGFTHIWLMGVWQVGPEARNVALRHWMNQWSNDFPSAGEGDVHGSPFAIQEYSVDSRLGTPLDLLVLKERLGQAGLKLILDFIPNHFGLDTPEPVRYPARFVQAQAHQAGAFLRETKIGPRWFAHGRDPYFPPWEDTVQIDYRVAEMQEAMASLAQTTSMFGEGLRCDMAMLLLPDVFREVWRGFPPAGTHLTDTSFWRFAIPKIRELQPHVDLIAEAYWNREESLQEAGFDYTYNKRVTDFIMRHQDAELADFLARCSVRYLQRSVHFLENHDEARAALVLRLRRHKAAAALILFLPGMTLLHDGQLEGRKLFSRIQLNKRPFEEPDPVIQDFYMNLLKAIPQTHVGRGRPELAIDNSAPNVIAIRWIASNGQTDLTLVNLSSAPASYPVPGPYDCLYSTDEPLIGSSGGLIVPQESAHVIRLKSVGG